MICCHRIVAGVFADLEIYLDQPSTGGMCSCSPSRPGKKLDGVCYCFILSPPQVTNEEIESVVFGTLNWPRFFCQLLTVVILAGLVSTIIAMLQSKKSENESRSLRCHTRSNPSDYQQRYVVAQPKLLLCAYLNMYKRALIERIVSMDIFG